jgi:hypothetical protein
LIASAVPFGEVAGEGRAVPEAAGDYNEEKSDSHGAEHVSPTGLRTIVIATSSPQNSQLQPEHELNAVGIFLRP